MLSCLVGHQTAANTPPSRYSEAINEWVTQFNVELQSRPGFTAIMKIPPYGKSKYIARSFMNSLFEYYGTEVINSIRSLPTDTTSPQYTDIPKLVAFIKGKLGHTE